MKNYNISAVKNQKSTQTGSHHWLMQRITAIALIPLVIWFVVISARIFSDPENGFLRLMSSPYNSIFFIIFISVMLYHASMGMKVIIEDYVHKKCWKHALIIAVNFASIITISAGIFTVIMIHLIMLLEGVAV